jgi:tetratricopeptide (TPR) repeat protein
VNRPQKRINVRVLIAVLAVAATTLVAVALVHQFQVRRNAGALVRLARSKQQEGNSTEALGLFSRYLAYKPDDAEAQAEFARLMIEFAERPTATKDDRSYAYRVLETAVRKNPDDTLLRRRLAEWMIRFGRFGDASQELTVLREQIVAAPAGTTAPAENAAPAGTTAPAALDLDAIDVLRVRALAGSGKFEEAAAVAAAIIGFDVKAKAFNADAEPKTSASVREASMLLANLLTTKLNSPDSGLVVLEHLTITDPKNVATWLTLAGWHRAQGNLAKATAAFRSAATIAPNNPNVLFADLELSMSEKRVDAADQIAAKARKLYPNDERSYRGVASVAMQRGDVETAVSVLREGLATQPGQPAMLQMLGDVLLRANRLDEAEETIDTFAQLHGDKRPAVGILQSRLLMARKRWLNAQRKLEAVRPLVAESDDVTRQVDLLLGQCHEMLGQFDEQLAVNQRVLLGDYNSLAARVGMANALVASGKPDAARAELEAVAASLPPDRLTSLPEVWSPLIQLRIADQMRRLPANRDWSQVERLLDLLEQSPAVSDGQIALLRSDLLVRQGDSPAAFEILRKLVDAKPSSVQPRAALAILVLREEGPAAARALLDTAPADIADDPQLLTVRTQIAARAPADESAAALAQLEEKALALPNEQAVRLLSTVASVHRGMGYPDQAERVWRAALKKVPDDIVIRNALFELACERGDVEKAQAGAEEISRLTGLTSTQTRVTAAATLLLRVRASQAKAAAADDTASDDTEPSVLSPAENEQLDAAKNLLIEAENDRPGWAQIQQLFAEIAILRGDIPTAIERLQQSTQMGPANASLIRQLVSLLYLSNRLEEAQQALAMVGPEGLGGMERVSAEIDLRMGQFDEAVAVAEGALASNRKNSASDLLWFGQLLGRAGKTDRAIEVLQQAVDADPQRPGGWTALFLAQVATGNGRAAEHTLEKGAEMLAPPQRQLLLAQGHEVLGRIDDAERSFREALTAAPGNPAATRSLAAFLIRQGRLSAAREQLRTIIAATSEDPAMKRAATWARRMLADMTIQTGSYPDMQRALALIADNADQDGRLAAEDVALQIAILAPRPEPGSWRRALGLLDTLASLQPLSTAQRIQKAQLLEQLGRWNECRDELLSIASAPNTPPTFQSLLIEKLIQHKDLEAARIWLKTLADRLPDAPIVTAIQAKLALAENNREAAVAAARKLMPTAAATPEMAGQLGPLSTLLEELGLNAAADQMFTQYAAVSTDGVLARAGFLGRAQRADEALDLLEASWDKLPLENLLRTAIAVLGSQATAATSPQVERIEQWFEKARRQDPDSPNLSLLFADFVGATGNHDDIVTTYRALLGRKDLSPQQAAVASNNLAFHLAAPATATEAERLVARAVAELGPLPDVLDTRGLVLLEMGRAPEAIADFNESLLIPTATKYLHLASALASEQQLEAARKAFAEAKKLGLAPHHLAAGDQGRLKALEAALGQ